MKNLLRKITALSAVQMLLLTTGAFAQEVIKQDNIVIGKPSTSADKVLKFDTNDGTSNPKLSVEKTSKKLKYDQNQFQLGGSLTTDNKEFIFNGDNKSLLYDGTSKDLRYTGEALSIGGGTNTDKALKFNNGATPPQIKYNSTTAKLQFSNNAVDFKDIGSGSGGGSTGVNLLENDSFEDPLTTGWASSGGTFSQQTYTNSVDGDTKFARLIASGAGQYFESTTKAIPTSFSGGCQADFKKYNTVTSSAFKVEALDSTNAVLATQILAAGSWVKTPTIVFQCPAAGTLVKIRVTSLLAGTIEVDRGYTGSNQNIVESQCQGTLECEDEFSASMSNTCIVTNENMDWIQSTTNPSTGRCVATYKAGLATVPMNCTTSVASGAQYFASVLSSTSTSIGTQTWQHDGVEVAQPVNISCQKQGVDFAKAKPQTAVSPEQASWFIDANIGGSAAIIAGIYSSFTEVTNSNLDLVLNNGSSNAKIACASGTNSTGSTCVAANESLGITFTNSLQGRHRVCFESSVDITSGTNAAITLAETTPLSSVIIQEGKSRQGMTSPSINPAFPFNLCGIFNFSDSKERTIRLMVENSANTTMTFLTDRSAVNGQRDLHVTIDNLTFGQNRPILLPNKKWQKKTLSIFAGTAGVVSALSFNNLTMGKSYRLSVQSHIYTQSNVTVGILYTNNGSQIVQNEFDPSDATPARRTFGSSGIFTASATNVVATLTASGGAGLESGDTWVILEELSDSEATSQFN